MLVKAKGENCESTVSWETVNNDFGKTELKLNEETIVEAANGDVITRNAISFTVPAGDSAKTIGFELQDGTKVGIQL